MSTLFFSSFFSLDGRFFYLGVCHDAAVFPLRPDGREYFSSLLRNMKKFFFPPLLSFISSPLLFSPFCLPQKCSRSTSFLSSVELKVFPPATRKSTDPFLPPPAALPFFFSSLMLKIERIPFSPPLHLGVQRGRLFS